MLTQEQYNALEESLQSWRRSENASGATFFGLIHPNKIGKNAVYHHMGNYACFYQLTICEDSVFLYGSNGGKADKPMNMRFISFITDPVESPWATWKDILFPRRSNLSREKEIELWTMRGMVVDNPDIPANVLINFFKCHRMMGEHADRIRLWNSLVDKGVPPREALFLCTIFSHTGKSILFHSFVNNPNDDLYRGLVYQKHNPLLFSESFRGPWPPKYRGFMNDNFLYVKSQVSAYDHSCAEVNKLDKAKRVVRNPFTRIEELLSDYSLDTLVSLSKTLKKKISKD